jgi:hypothetical protein
MLQTYYIVIEDFFVYYIIKPIHFTEKFFINFPARPFLDAFVELRKKQAISFVMSVCPSTRNNLAPNGQIFMMFYIYAFNENLSRKFTLN